MINEEPNPIAEMNETEKIQTMYEQGKEYKVHKDRYDIVINKKLPPEERTPGMDMSKYNYNSKTAAKLVSS